MRKLKGFTLIEIIIVIVLIGILASIGSMMIRQNFKGYFMAKNINELASQTNIAANNVMRELKSASQMTAMSAASITFLNQRGQSIVIDVNGTTLRRNVNGGGAQTQCSDITSATFAYYDSAFATTAVLGNVRFITMQLVASKEGFPYSVMASTVLRKLLP